MNRGAIILCGGGSARMGRDKATLPFGLGEVMLQRVVRLVAEVVPAERIVCVAAPQQQLPTLPADVLAVHDPEPQGGPLVGLVGGFHALEGRADAIFATGCDVPLLVPALVSRLFDLLGDDQVAVPDDGKRCHPLAAVYRSDIQPIAQSLLASGRRSLQELLDACRTRRVPADDLRDVDPQLDSLAACNTPEDYQRLLAHATS